MARRELQFCCYAKVEIAVQPLTDDWMDFKITVRAFLPESGPEYTWNSFTEFEPYYAYIDVYETEKWGKIEREKFRLIVIPHEEIQTPYRRGVMYLNEHLTQAISSMASTAEYWLYNKVIEFYRRCGFKADHIIAETTMSRNPLFPDC